MAFRTAVITFPGSNCDRDMAVALETITGTAPARVWHGDADLPEGLDFIALPGGFPMAITCAAVPSPRALR